MAIKKPGKGSGSKQGRKGQKMHAGMAIDKSNTPTWMKATLILLAIVFMSSFVTVGASSCSEGVSTGGPATNDPVATAKGNFEGTVNALTGLLASDPTSYTLLVNLGDQYFNWARELSSSAQTSTAAAEAAYAKWTSASETYARALETSSGTPSVKVDYAFSLFNSQDTTKAIEVASGVLKSDPKFAMAPFALGEFYSYKRDNQSAIKYFNQYLALDKKDEWGNNAYAKDAVKQLSSGTTTK